MGQVGTGLSTLVRREGGGYSVEKIATLPDERTNGVAVQVWIGEKPENPNERKAIIALATGLDRLDGLYVMLANFSVGGHTIDLVILKRDAIFILELKHCDGRIFGAVNGPWTVVSRSGSTKQLNPGRKNPYNQVISYFYSFTNSLNDHKAEIVSAQKRRMSTSVRPSVWSSWCRRSRPVPKSSSIWKVQVKGLDELPTYLVVERSACLELGSGADAYSQATALHALAAAQRPDRRCLATLGGNPQRPARSGSGTCPRSIPRSDQPRSAAALRCERVYRAGWRARSPSSRSARWCMPLRYVRLCLRNRVSWRRSPRVLRLRRSQPFLRAASRLTSATASPICMSVWEALGRDANKWSWERPEDADVLVTLETVDFNNGQIRLTWTIENRLQDTIDMPMTRTNFRSPTARLSIASTSANRSRSSSRSSPAPKRRQP